MTPAFDLPCAHNSHAPTVSPRRNGGRPQAGRSRAPVPERLDVVEERESQAQSAAEAGLAGKVESVENFPR
jgi:hypothetical protein